MDTSVFEYWTRPLLQIGISVKNLETVNSVDPDEMARNEPSHLELHCLYKYLFWSTRLKGLRGLDIPSMEMICHGNTVIPLYTDTRYNDKIRYNDNLNVTKPSHKR